MFCWISNHGPTNRPNLDDCRGHANGGRGGYTHRFEGLEALNARYGSRGFQAHPLFAELAKRTGEQPSWNFNKYLVGPLGKNLEPTGESPCPMTPGAAALALASLTPMAAAGAAKCGTAKKCVSAPTCRTRRAASLRPKPKPHQPRWTQLTQFQNRAAKH
jgi:hypothetical protein